MQFFFLSAAIVVLDNLVFRSVGAQVTKTRDVVQADVQLVLRIHVLIQSVDLFLMEESPGSAYVSMAVVYGSSGRLWISRQTN